MIYVQTRLGRWASAAAVLVGVCSAGVAEEPFAAPASRVEIYHGTTRVPIPPPAAWAPQPYPVPAPIPTGVEVAPMPASQPHVIQTGAVAPAISAENREPAPAPQHQTVVVIREPATVPQPTAAPQPPTVVVVREAEPRAPVAPAPAPTLPATEWLLPGAVGMGLMFIAVAIGLRRSTPAPAAVLVAPAPAAAPPQPAKPPETGQLIGGYDIGPAPKTAQKFDAGPSYAEERKAQEQHQEHQENALLEFVMNQNLAFRDALDATPFAEEIESSSVWVDQPAP